MADHSYLPPAVAAGDKKVGHEGFSTDTNSRFLSDAIHRKLLSNGNHDVRFSQGTMPATSCSSSAPPWNPPRYTPISDAFFLLLLHAACCRLQAACCTSSSDHPSDSIRLLRRSVRRHPSRHPPVPSDSAARPGSTSLLVTRLDLSSLEYCYYVAS